ncbi:hypothetical protein NBRC116599_25920 [Aquicoccus sp. SU-CL01552]
MLFGIDREHDFSQEPFVVRRGLVSPNTSGELRRKALARDHLSKADVIRVAKREAALCVFVDGPGSRLQVD